MRIASYNIENLDTKSGRYTPTLDERIPPLRNMLKRINADVLCLQEVHGQELPDHTSRNPSRDLSALRAVIEDTQYEDYHVAHTVTSDQVAYNERNLVVLSRFPVEEVEQYRNEFIDDLQYRKVTAIPEEQVKDVRWERPIQHVTLNTGHDKPLHMINLHLKSRLASNVEGQKNGYMWNSAAGWAEGYFLSSLKRVGQALETRILVDHILDGDADARIVVCGDYNSEPGEVPVEAIRGRVEETSNPGLRNRVLVPCSMNLPESSRFSHYHHGQGNLLDHMMISQDLVQYFSQAALFNENLHDESLPFTDDRKFPESDHAPFVAEFMDFQ